MAAQEKHGETQRDDSPKDPAYGGSKHANDLRGSEPDLARMVWVLQAQQSKCLWERRRLRARTTAQHPEKAKQKRKGADAEAIIGAGQMPTSPQWACIP